MRINAVQLLCTEVKSDTSDDRMAEEQYEVAFRWNWCVGNNGDSGYSKDCIPNGCCKNLDISLVNVGSEYAKNINISFMINKEDCLLTDKNIFWLYESLPLENHMKDQVE